jgi:protein TonB
MVQGGFYERRKMSPTAVAVVLLLHGAAITALVMAKEGGFTRVKPPPIVIDFVPPDKEPPPKPKPLEPQQQQQVVTHVPPLIDLPVPSPLPTPPMPPQPPRLDPLPAPKGSELPPMPAPPPPQPEVKLQPARAKANLGSYVSDADYPSDAIRREEQGATRFRLAVGPDGRVTNCTVTASSGSAALDLATCRLMKSRARFAPARDTSGNPIGDTVSSTIVWRLPAG